MTPEAASTIIAIANYIVTIMLALFSTTMMIQGVNSKHRSVCDASLIVSAVVVLSFFAITHDIASRFNVHVSAWEGAYQLAGPFAGWLISLVFIRKRKQL